MSAFERTLKQHLVSYRICIVGDTEMSSARLTNVPWRCDRGGCRPTGRCGCQQWRRWRRWCESRQWTEPTQWSTELADQTADCCAIPSTHHHRSTPPISAPSHTRAHTHTHSLNVTSASCIVAACHCTYLLTLTYRTTGRRVSIAVDTDAGFSVAQQHLTTHHY